MRRIYRHRGDSRRRLVDTARRQECLGRRASSGTDVNTEYVAVSASRLDAAVCKGEETPDEWLGDLRMMCSRRVQCVITASTAVSELSTGRLLPPCEVEPFAIDSYPGSRRKSSAPGRLGTPQTAVLAQSHACCEVSRIDDACSNNLSSNLAIRQASVRNPLRSTSINSTYFFGKPMANLQATRHAFAATRACNDS